MIDKEKILKDLNQKINVAKITHQKFSEREYLSILDIELKGKYHGEMIALQYLKDAIELGVYNS